MQLCQFWKLVPFLVENLWLNYHCQTIWDLVLFSDSVGHGQMGDLNWVKILKPPRFLIWSPRGVFHVEKKNTLFERFPRLAFLKFPRGGLGFSKKPRHLQSLTLHSDFYPRGSSEEEFQVLLLPLLPRNWWIQFPEMRKSRRWELTDWMLRGFPSFFLFSHERALKTAIEIKQV